METLAEWRDVLVAYPWLAAAMAAWTGAVMASFGGVVVDRLPHALQWREDPKPGVNLWSRSRCDACGGPVGALALVPVLGWLLCRGRCSRCGAAVPAAYPVAEGATALASAATVAWFGVSGEAAWALGALWACVVLAWIDWRECWLPDCVTVPLFFAGLLGSPFEPDPEFRIYGAFGCFLALWLSFWFLGRAKGVDAMSGGDLVLAAAAGAWLGMALIPAWLGIAALAFGATSVPAYRNRTGGEPVWVPMGPALCASFLACLWFGDALAMG